MPEFAQYLVICVFSFLMAISVSKALGSGSSGYAVCISACLTLLTPCTISS